ncbi:helix-turn-helix domain-containing protein [Streptomyces monticola]|uniref:Helix-turn-helix domain-containing protein n=1 Tax=Streptomyces monticola TaxID=2666263 RepID=A0ABW2JNR8_9ACTN
MRTVSPRTAVRRLEPGSGPVEVAYREPHPRLRELGVRWFGYREHEASQATRRHVPGARVGLVFGFGDGLRVTEPSANGGTTSVHHSFIAGPHATALESTSLGRLSIMQLELSPACAHAVFGVPLHELSNGVVDLRDLIGRSADEICERLAEAPDWDARFTLLEQVLTAPLDQARDRDHTVLSVWDALRHSHGQARISELADRAGWTRRHLDRRFLDRIGLPPKTMARVLRIQRALDLIRTDSDLSWATVAAECGYYDQAHFNREFRGIVGCTPTTLRAEWAARPAGAVQLG